MSQQELFEFPPRKRCSRCHERKTLDEFSRNRSTRDGRQTYCRLCYNRIIRSYKEKKHGSERNFLLKLRYGIDEDRFERILRRQGGTCAICRSPRPKHVDHCHDSSAVRGILCVNCNNGLGKFEDDVGIMERAILYLGDS